MILGGFSGKNALRHCGHSEIKIGVAKSKLIILKHAIYWLNGIFFCHTYNTFFVRFAIKYEQIKIIIILPRIRKTVDLGMAARWYSPTTLLALPVATERNFCKNATYLT